MRGKSFLKKIFFILCFVAAVNALFTVDDYLLKLLRVFISISFILLFLIFVRNITMTNWLFRNRFYWFYPIILLISLSFYLIMIIIFNAEMPSVNKVLAIILIALSIGFFWGAVERFREHKYLSGENLCETVDLVTKDLDTINRGALVKNNDNKFAFKKKDEFIFEFTSADVKKVNIKKEYKIFPIMLEIELHNGEKYNFESQFPFVWKNLITA